MSSEYFKNLDVEAQTRYIEKLKFKGAELPDPNDNQLRSNIFHSNAMKKWPQVTFGNVYIYLVFKKCYYTEQAFEYYKGLDCYNYILSGKVNDVRVFRNNILQICVVTCTVQASQTIAKFHCPWAVIECNGNIQNAHCTCMAGLGEACSHISALLLTIEIGVREEKLEPSCTSLPCEWKKSVKKVPLVPSSTLKFSLKRNVKKTASSINAPCLSSESAFKHFLGIVRKHQPDAAIFTCISDSEDTDSASETEERSLVEEEKSLALEIPNLIDYIKEIAVQIRPDLPKEEKVDAIFRLLNSRPSEKREEIEQATREQGETWFSVRKGIITASLFHKVLHCRTGQKAVVEAILQKMEPREFPATNYGKIHEAKALSIFEAFMSPKHTNFKMMKTGLLLDEELPYLGATPDGRVSCDCCGTALVEVKCPYVARNSTVTECLDKIKYLDKNLKLKRNHPYFMQIQGQMGIWKEKKFYFVVYASNDVKVDLIVFQEDIWNCKKPLLSSFFKEYVLPEILN